MKTQNKLFYIILLLITTTSLASCGQKQTDTITNTTKKEVVESIIDEKIVKLDKEFKNLDELKLNNLLKIEKKIEEIKSPEIKKIIKQERIIEKEQKILKNANELEKLVSKNKDLSNSIKVLKESIQKLHKQNINIIKNVNLIEQDFKNKRINEEEYKNIKDGIKNELKKISNKLGELKN